MYFFFQAVEDPFGCRFRRGLRYFEAAVYVGVNRTQDNRMNAHSNPIANADAPTSTHARSWVGAFGATTCTPNVVP
jgi:hypothetical protein